MTHGNIVMTALRWLDRTPESFLPGHAGEPSPSAIADGGPGHLLRWNGPRLYGALDQQRTELGLTWTAVAKEIGLPVGVITRTKVADQLGFPSALYMTTWLERPASDFVDDVSV